MHDAPVDTPRARRLHCVGCGADVPNEDARRARIRSNVKPFAHEAFTVWQCDQCSSIHAADPVELDRYYASYPFHRQRLSPTNRLICRSRVRALTRLGLTKDQRVLDFGCGSGLLVQYLSTRGYRHSRGFEPYASDGPFAEPPGAGHDVVLSQDVIEHLSDPIEHLRDLIALAKPGGLLVIGTPDAGVIDLTKPERYIHMLHQPYHRHILSRTALLGLAGSLGLELVAVKYGFLGNTRVPGLNARYLMRMLRATGDVLDDVLAGSVPLRWSLVSPGAFWDAFTGSWRDPGHDLTVALRVPGPRVAPALT